jgi:hypothetical protein
LQIGAEQNPQRDVSWEAQVTAMHDKLARESRRSALMGFLGGVIVMGGVVLLVYATVQSNKKLATQVVENGRLDTKVKVTAARANAAQEQAASVNSVLGATVGNLQKESPGVSASATTALNKAIDANPSAARFIVRVYIHMPTLAERPGANQIATALRAAGYLVAGIDVQPAQKYRETQVHYYTADPQSLADVNSIQKIVSGLDIPVKTLQVPAAKTDSLHPRAYGLWLATDVK